MRTIRPGHLLLVLICVALVSAETASAGRTPSTDSLRLRQVLTALRVHYPTAEVIGRFYDWRTVSVYRSRAGLHNGYDIALPPGATIFAPWSGRVVDIVHWYGLQYGITVQTGRAFTTYGHLTPDVQVGDWVPADRPIGRTLIDHVDIKMRDASGRYIDFGAGQVDLDQPTTRAEVMAYYRHACCDVLLLTEQMRDKYSRIREQELMLRSHQADQMQASMPALLVEGVVSRQEVDSARARCSYLHRELAEVRQRPLVQLQLQLARDDMSRSRKLALSLGLKVPMAPRPKRAESSAKKETLERLFHQGCISRDEMLNLMADPSWQPVQ